MIVVHKSPGVPELPQYGWKETASIIKQNAYQMTPLTLLSNLFDNSFPQPTVSHLPSLRMSVSSTSAIRVQAMPASSLRSFRAALSSLPEEVIIEILEYALSLPGCIAKTEFCVGFCEWPSCRCQDGSWHHTPAKQLTNDTLTPLLIAPEPIPRLAQLAFYISNTFHLCGPQNDVLWVGGGFWLPPSGFRHWIQRLEVEVQINFPRPGSLTNAEDFGIVPALDWQFLRRLQQGVHGFTGLRNLKLMFEALFITKDEQLRKLDEQLGKIEPFSFQTQDLFVEACSAYPLWLEDDCNSGDIILDERLGKVLEKYMSATGKRRSSRKSEINRATGRHWWQGRE